MLFLEAENPEKDIIVYINSPGGSVSAGLRDLRHDAVRQARLATLHTDSPASMGAVPPGRRRRKGSGPRSERPCPDHQPHGGRRDRCRTSRSRPRRCSGRRKRSTRFPRLPHGPPFDRIEKDTDRDNIFEADAAKGIRPDRPSFIRPAGRKGAGLTPGDFAGNRRG